MFFIEVKFFPSTTRIIDNIFYFGIEFISINRPNSTIKLRVLKQMPQRLAITFLYLASIFFFVLGLTQPIMRTSKFFGWKKDEIYLTNSIQYFFEEGEAFIAIILLVFTFILPLFKYLFIGIQLLFKQEKTSSTINTLLGIVNKWAMLDVFVVALVIVNLKMDSGFIKTSIASGTNWFALSIVLLMVCSSLLQRRKTGF